MSVGRGVFWKKSTVEDSLRIDMKNFARDVDLTSFSTGYTRWKSSFGKEDRIGWKVNPEHSIRLMYTVTNAFDEKKDHDYEVLIETTPCNYGGALVVPLPCLFQALSDIISTPFSKRLRLPHLPQSLIQKPAGG